MVQKLIIGLTGGFGSGKSTVSGIFRGCGAGVIDADKIAHEALKKSSPIFTKITALFPEAVSRCGRHFHRRKIAEKIFSDPRKRERLESLIHPYVLRRVKEKIVAMKQKVAVVEVPLLFEAGFDVFCDKVVVVTCSPSVKRKRLLAKGFGLKEIRARERAQMPESLKSKKADFVINNSNSILKTSKDAERLWKRLAAIVSTT